MLIGNYSIILGREWKLLIGGYYSMDGSHTMIYRGTKNIIVYREDRIVPYIENHPQPSVKCIKEDLGIYSIFNEEETNHQTIGNVTPNLNLNRHNFFDGASSQDGNGVGILLQNHFGKSYSYSYHLKLFMDAQCSRV